MKKWRIKRPDEKKTAEFRSKCDLNKLTLDVMTARGFTDFDSLVEFFNGEELSDPFTVKDMELAADVINNAVDAYDLICIYGDYDCDGVTSTTILYNYLESMGANVMYYIPEREDGYGMNVKAIEALAEKGVKLIVTVDNGISAVEEAERIAELDMELVITDHHQPPEKLPRARAIVDPHQVDCPSTYKDLAGVGVALKLCAALDGGSYESVMEQYADICAIGTVADVVPLTGENRTIVKRGLEFLKNTEVLGLNSLLDKTKIDRNNINSTGIAFRIAPVINASGRFGSPLTAVKTLLCEDPEDSDSYSETLMTLNTMRKQTETEIMTEIVNYINADPQVLDHRVLVLSGKGWHHGVIGIVSSRILEFYGKPNIIISIDDNGNARGSARSVKGFNIFKCFQHCGDVLEKFGGHECAGGLSLAADRIEDFTKLVYEYSEAMESFPALEFVADKLLMPEDISVDSIKGLNSMEPFGAENPQPVFAILGARVDKIIPLSQGKHTKIEFTYGGYHGQALIFSLAPEKACFAVGDKIDMLVNLEVNVFNGRESAAIKVIDHRLSGVKQDRYFAAKDCYEKLMRGEELPANFIRKIIPTRQELVDVYKHINAVKNTTLDNLFMKLSSDSMNYCKLHICIDIFSDKELVEFKPATMKIKILPTQHRVNLEESDTLVRLHSMLKGR